MDATHLHLVLTHFPIVGTILGAVIIVSGKFLKNESIIKVALLTFIAMAILTIPVYFSGEGAEEKVEHLAGVSEDIIHNHEEFAEKAIWLMGLLGIFSLIAFLGIVRNAKSKTTTILIALILSLVTAGAFIQVGSLGGQIRHSEIRTDGSGNQDSENGAIKEHDDDD